MGVCELHYSRKRLLGNNANDAISCSTFLYRHLHLLFEIDKVLHGVGRTYSHLDDDQHHFASTNARLLKVQQSHQVEVSMYFLDKEKFVAIVG